MIPVSIDLAPRSFAVCIWEQVFNSEYNRISPIDIILHSDCSVTVYLTIYEAEKLADKFEKMLPNLNVGFAKQFRDKQRQLIDQVMTIERGMNK
jgi:hypothetical protein